MAFYKTPVRPFDPVLEDDKDSQASRYYRDSFDGTGQDSRTEPPAQDASMWSLLTNIQPITRGGLDARWGYLPFAVEGELDTRLYSYQRDSDLLRTIIASSGADVEVFNEDGSVYPIGSAHTLFVPKAPPRLVNSRSYAYFFSGNANDLKKWDGTSTPFGAAKGVTNWGIDFPSTSVVSLQGPGAGSAASGWPNASNVFVSDGQFASQGTAINVTDSVPLSVSGFGFSIPSTATILGIKVEIQGLFSSTDTVNTKLFSASLMKNLTPSSNGNEAAITTTNGFVTLGGASDLWGTGWLPSDINSPNFGVSIQGISRPGTNAITVYFVDFIRVSVTYSGPSNVITVANGGGGSVTLTVGRIYYTIFANSTTGHLSDLSPASGSTGPLSSAQVSLTTIPVSTDPQADSKIIVATADGGDPSSLYFVTQLPNATTTFSDNIPETTLLLNQLYLFTDQFGNDFGVAANTPPPNGNLCIKHKGRLWMAVNQNLYFSKSIAELTLPNGFVAGKYEESWPKDTFLDISEGAETVSGLLSNGQALFIGTQRHIRWVTGDDQTNFSEPEIIHAEVGVLNQDVWQSVFIQGTPSGCIWLTPDFRVIGSDFNAYHDIGHPIQDVLDSINPAAAQAAHAMFVSDGEYDLYILAIPTGINTACDTHCVFNMRSQMWVIWKPTDPSGAMLFNVSKAGVPQWLFSTAFNIMRYSGTVSTDNGATFVRTAQTSWMHLGAPSHRKLLDELEVVGDPNMLITVEGASPSGDFNSGSVLGIKFLAPLVLSPFKQQKLYLASSGAKHRYYRLTFIANTTNAPFLRSYNLKSIPFNTL